MSTTNKEFGNVTEVLVYEIPSEKEEEYRDWIAKIQRMESTFPGFRSVYVQPPENGRRWITLLQFDSVNHLDNWLHSKERQEILAGSESFISSLESHRLNSPYGVWFKSGVEEGKTPALWKQTMIILMVLFPIVMLEIKLLTPRLTGLDLSIATFIGNAISVSLLSWPMLPAANRLLKWWLFPKGNKKMINFYGAILLLLIYIVEILFFWKFK